MLAHTSHRGELPNLASAAVEKAIAPVRLTRKESQLLAVLQQNAGRCMPRGYLLETVWGYRNGTRTRTLDVHIQRLRHKLGPEEAARILTVLRSGYAWLDGSGEKQTLQ
jgi:DNA-binding response OmpR family regulator